METLEKILISALATIMTFSPVKAQTSTQKKLSIPNPTVSAKNSEVDILHLVEGVNAAIKKLNYNETSKEEYKKKYGSYWDIPLSVSDELIRSNWKEVARALNAIKLLFRAGEGERVLGSIDELLHIDCVNPSERFELFKTLEKIAINGNQNAIEIMVGYRPKELPYDDYYHLSSLGGVLISDKTPQDLKDLIVKSFVDLSKKYKGATQKDILRMNVSMSIVRSENMQAHNLEQLLPIVISGYINASLSLGHYIEDWSVKAMQESYERKDVNPQLTELENGVYKLIGGTDFKNYGWLLWIGLMNNAYHNAHEKNAQELIQKNKKLLDNNLYILKKVSPKQAEKIFFGLFSPDEFREGYRTGITSAGGIAGNLTHEYALIEILQQYPEIKAVLDSIHPNQDTAKDSNLTFLNQGLLQIRLSNYPNLTREQVRKKEMNIVKAIGEHGNETERALYQKLF